MRIIIDERACEMERLAAIELMRYLDTLFCNISVEIGTLPDEDEACFYLFTAGSGLSSRFGSAVSPNGEEGYRIKSFKTGAAVVAICGGSPRAVLWGVYELVERWGVRYLLRRDVLPEMRAFEVPDIDIVREPNMPIRSWTFPHGLSIGPEAWGFEDYKTIIAQLAKMRFNRITFQFYPRFPLLHMEYQGIRRETAGLFFDMHFPIRGDMIGRELFDDRREFYNPDLPLDAGCDEMIEAGRKLVGSVMDMAHALGMECVVNATINEFLPEFAPLLHGAVKVKLLEEEYLVPGPDMEPDDPGLLGLALYILKQTAETYPQADCISFVLPEWRQWTGKAEKAFEYLDRNHGIGKIASLESMLNKAAKRTEYPGGGARAIDEVRGDIAGLHFFDLMMEGWRKLPGKPDKNFKFIYLYAAEELYPILSAIVPQGVELYFYMDYTPARVLRRSHEMGNLDSAKLPSVIMATMNDDNVGIVPQLMTGELHWLMKDIRKYGWQGFSTRYWLTSDQDLCAAYLAKSAWDAEATPHGVYWDYLEKLCGEDAANDMLGAFAEIESASNTLEWEGLGFSFPIPGMLMGYWDKDADPGKYRSVRLGYERALSWARQAVSKVAEPGKKFVEYWVGRLEFGAGYVLAVEEIGKAAAEENEGRADSALRHAEQALEHLRGAVSSYAGVCMDQSDRGAIAVLNEFAYFPLLKKINEMKTD